MLASSAKMPESQSERSSVSGRNNRPTPLDNGWNIFATGVSDTYRDH